MINENYKQAINRIAKTIVSKLGNEFEGSESDLIHNTIVNVLKDEYKNNYLDVSDYCANQIIKNLITYHKDEINFDFVFEKVYSIFKEPLLSEMVFDKVSEKLEKDYNIPIENLEVSIW